MKKLSRDDLWSLEEYAERRAQFRVEVMRHKAQRQLPLNEHVRLYFEDALTIRYQVQEMLRIEKIFEGPGIEEELHAYNPLIPDGSNWKATLMLEYDDPAERQQVLQQLLGIENRVWLQVQGCERVYPIADEDLERSDGERTSTVHFLRFELGRDMISALHAGSPLYAGIDHPAMTLASTLVSESIRRSLANDLAEVTTH